MDSGAGLKADTWALSETTQPGYTAERVGLRRWSRRTASNITVGIGGEATCTITNDDIAPKLHLRKVVVNDNGGTATVADFTLTANGAGTNDLSGISPVDSDGTVEGGHVGVVGDHRQPGTRPARGSASVARRTASNITVGIGGEATCTITNDDIAPKLHLRKVVVNDNGGTKTVADFTLTANGDGRERSVGHEPGGLGGRSEGRHVGAVGDAR